MKWAGRVEHFSSASTEHEDVHSPGSASQSAVFCHLVLIYNDLTRWYCSVLMGVKINSHLPRQYPLLRSSLSATSAQLDFAHHWLGPHFTCKETILIPWLFSAFLHCLQMQTPKTLEYAAVQPCHFTICIHIQYACCSMLLYRCCRGECVLAMGSLIAHTLKEALWMFWLAGWVRRSRAKSLQSPGCSLSRR